MHRAVQQASASLSTQGLSGFPALPALPCWLESRGQRKAGLAVLEGSAYQGEAAVAVRRGADLMALVRSGRPQSCSSQPADGCLTTRSGDWGSQAQLETCAVPATWPMGADACQLPQVAVTSAGCALSQAESRLKALC